MKWDWSGKSLKTFWGIVFALLLFCLCIVICLLHT